MPHKKARQTRKKPIRLRASLQRLQQRVPARAMLLGLVVAVAGITALRFGLAENSVPEVPKTPPSPSAEEIAPERIIVRYKPGVSAAEMSNVAVAAEADEKDQIPQLRMRVLNVPRAERAATLERLKADPRVEYAEPEQLFYLTAKPNDPEYPKQWALPTINADLLWDKHTGSNITIAAIDTGVNERPDLAGKLVPGHNFWNDSNDTSDTVGHGTAVSSVLAANTNNSLGIAGTCWSCRIMPLKITDPSGPSLASHIIEAITYATDNGAKVINISVAAEGGNSALDDAINYATSKDVVVVAGAGNSGDDVMRYPAGSPNAISVAATLPNDTLAPFSTFGSTVDIAAPGYYRLVAHDSDGYKDDSGTSYSSPAVAGVVAVLRSAFPNATAAQVRDAVTSTADPCCDNKISGGRLNAIKAYNKLEGTLNNDTTKPTLEILSPLDGATISGPSVIAVAHGADNNAVAKIHMSIGGSVPTVCTSATCAVTLNSTAKQDGPLALTFTAYDAAGNSAQATRNVTVNNASPDTTKPTATITAPAEGATISGAVQVDITASDTNGISKIQFIHNGAVAASSYVPPYHFTLNTASIANGPYPLTIRAFDANSNQTDVVHNVTIQNGTTPPPSTPPPTTPPPTTPPPTTPPPGGNPKSPDINGSGKVDLTDLSILLSNWNKTTANADLNSSGKVDLTDLSMLLSKWNTPG